MNRIKAVVVVCFIAAVFAVFLTGRQAVSARSQNAPNEAPAAPTGVIATDTAFADKIGIRWDAIRGATVYRIFRGTTSDPSGAIDVGTTAAGYFYDMTPAAGVTYHYWVRAENPSGASPLSASDTGKMGVGGYSGGPFPPLEPPEASPQNPVTAAKAYLGKTLFWDEQLSSTRTVSCGTCHRPSHGGSDPRTNVNSLQTRNPGPDGVFNTDDDISGSRGVIRNNADGTYSVSPIFGFNEQVTGRKAPSYLNAAYSPNGNFWDGRATDEFRDPLTNNILIPSNASLESQSMGPPVSDAEMAHSGRNIAEVAARMQSVKPLALATNVPQALKTWIGGRTYPELFQEVFGTPDVTPARIAMAIGTHERSLFSDETPLDREAYGLEKFNFQEEMGRSLFINLQCNVCHEGSLLADHQFRNIGVRPPAEDRGRGAVTGNAGNDGEFKTPTLRNVELRGPFMHNGRFATLEDVVEFYNRGGDADAPNIDHSLIRPLFLTTEQKAALVAFMKRPLTDVRVRDELPPFDRPTLYTESDRVPVVQGTGLAGTGSIVPQPVAISPPITGNPQFTVGIKAGLGGASAVLSIGTSDPGVGSSIPTGGTFAYRSVTLTGSGAGNGFGSTVIAIPDNPAMVGRRFYGRWYVTDPAAANGFSVSPVFTFKVFSAASSTLHATHADFDGDGRTDVSVYRASTAAWYIRNSDTQSVTAIGFGLPTDKLVPADYDGDGKADVAVYRDGTWFTMQSTNGFNVFNFGSAGDIPMPGDFDGDGRSDYAVFRPSNGVWYVWRTTLGFYAIQFGQNGDKPFAGDFDGDGMADYAVYRDGIWFIWKSTGGYVGIGFGLPTDKPVAGDYNGDGMMDVAVWRPSNGYWYILESPNLTFRAVQFGVSTDQPAPGDYDGDGKWDPAVFRGGTWYMLGSQGGFFATSWGLAGDSVVPAAYVP